MNGINKQDQLLSYYPCERKTVGCYKKLFTYVLHMCLLNAFLLYNKYSTDKKMSLLEFKITIVEGLSMTPLRLLMPRGRIAIEDILTIKQRAGPNNRSMRKRCVVHFRNGKKKDTIYLRV